MDAMSVNHSDEEDSCTPPDICEEANIATLDLLPAKSKTSYESCYKNFQDWKKTSNTKSSSERVLMAYFKNLAQKYKPSTLWSQYSMLKTTMRIYEKLNIKEYYMLSAFMKKQSHGFKSKKSKVLTTEDVNKFSNEAPDDEYLLIKVALIFGVSGALRKEEITNISVNDIEHHGDLILVRIPHTKNTKCTVQVVGKNKIGAMPKIIAGYLDLPDKDLYTGHCFRRTSATILADTGENITTLKRHGGWKSTNVAEGYIDESIQNKSKIGGLISSAIHSDSSTSTENKDDNLEKSNSGEPLPKATKIDDTPKSASAQGFTNVPTSSERIDSSNDQRYFNFHNCKNIAITYKGV